MLKFQFGLTDFLSLLNSSSNLSTIKSQGHKTAIIIDGNAIIYKAYYASAYGKNKMNNLIKHETLSIINKTIINLLQDKDYTYGLVVFDSSRKTFRQEKLPSYKADRPPMPETLKNSIPQIINIFKNTYRLSVLLSPPNYEADDLIGTIAKKFNEQETRTDIFTTDSDLLQLVNHLTTVNLIKKGLNNIVNYTHNNFEELNDGLLPYQIPLLKAIAGDSSDNYKGIPGIGETTAKELIRTYKNKNKIISNKDKLTQKIQNLFEAHEKDLDLYLEIAEIIKDLSFNNSLEDFVLKKT